MAFLVQRSDVGEFRQRYRWLVLVAIAAFGILVGRLAQLQLVEGDVHRAQARKNIVRERSLATTRGVIRDAFGRVLAANRPSYSVHITPAVIETDILKQITPQHVESMRSTIPMGRFGEPEEMASAVLFLASDDSSFMTANTFLVDGGISGAYVTPL